MTTITTTIDEIPPMAPGIFRSESAAGTGPELLGSLCPACGRPYFPARAYCPTCLEPMIEVALGGRGVIYSYTVVRARAPLGLPQPYSVGYVDLEPSGLRVFALLDHEAIAQLRVGLPVRLAVAPLGDDGHGSPRLRPFFTPSGNHPADPQDTHTLGTNGNQH